MCEYDDYNAEFVAVLPHIFSSGEEDSTYIPKMSSNGTVYLGNYTRFYGFINNYSGRGIVSGSLDLSVATE